MTIRVNLLNIKISMLGLPRNWTARRCKGRKGHFEEFIHCLNVFDKVFELGGESVNRVRKNSVEVRLAVSYQVQLFLYCSSHCRLY